MGSGLGFGDKPLGEVCKNAVNTQIDEIIKFIRVVDRKQVDLFALLFQVFNLIRPYQL
jgi:hypothetical protein